MLAPFLGIGPYSISRQIERAEDPDLKAAFLLFSRNTFHILNMGLVLLLFFLVWVMVANLILLSSIRDSPHPVGRICLPVVGLMGGVQLLVVGTYAGGIIALLVLLSA